jgi:hypothetical protein
LQANLSAQPQEASGGINVMSEKLKATGNPAAFSLE